MPKYEIVYTETRTKRAVVIAPDKAEAYDYFHNDCIADHDTDPPQFEAVEEGDWRYHDERTEITEVNDAD